MKIFKDDIPAPLGIAAEEWEERKRKLKSKAWIRLVLLFLVTVFLGEGMIWVHGGYETLTPKSLEELQVKSGIFHYGGRISSASLNDPVTGDVIMTSRKWSLSADVIARSRRNYVTVWYYVGQGGTKYVYQSKINDVLELDLDVTNQAVGKVNKQTKEINEFTRIGWNLLFLFFWPFECNQQYQKWLLKQK